MSSTKICKRCGYSWDARIEEPVACPRCKSYDWDKERMFVRVLKE